MFDRKYILRLILPLIVEQLFVVSVGMVDTLMVSTVGEVAVSGVALVDNINRLIIQVMTAFATGGVVVTSQYYGKKDHESAKKTCAQLESIMLIFSLVIMFTFCVFHKVILKGIFGSIENDVLHASSIYLVITGLSYPFLGMYNAGAAIYRSFGNSKISMKISVAMNIVNVLFNAFFVFGLHMGVLGVGIATLISRIVAGMLMNLFVFSSHNELRVNTFQSFIPKKVYISKILKIGIPSGIENGMFQIGKLAVVGIIATLGTDAIAANAVAYQIIDFPNIPGVAMGLALITIAGQTYGAGNYDETRKMTRKIVKYAYLGDWICKGCLFFSAVEIVNLFSLSGSASTISVLVLRCFCIASIPVWPLSFTLPNALRAAGDVNYTMFVSIISMWLFRVISSYVLVSICGFGVLGAWIGMFIDWYIRGIFYLLRFLSNRWQKKTEV